MLTPRENIIHFFKNQPYDHVPSGMDMKPFMPSLISINVARGAVFQQNPLSPEKFGGPDWFGVEWVFDPRVNGSIEKRPLLDDIDDLDNWEERIHFPDLDELDWAGCVEENREYLDTDCILHSQVYSSYFERLISFVGFENAAMALVVDDYKDSVKALFDRLTDFYIDVFRHYHRDLGIEMITVHDDWGSQRSLLFSIDTHAEMILPYITRLYAAAHEEGIIVDQHSCGRIETLIPSIIQSGVDTWRPQPINDIEGLIRDYGDRFKFTIDGFFPKAGSDEEALECLKNVLKQCRGKKVFVSIPPPPFLPTSQRELFGQFLASDECRELMTA